MILRLLLALLLVLPAGLSAGQHQRCEPMVDATAMDSGSAPHHESGEGHHARHGGSADLYEVAAPANDYDSCDLACKVSCAAIALPLGTQQPASTPRTAVVPGNVVAGLLNPHPLALLRPPAPTPT